MFLWIKALHIIAMVTWMSALLYLPRLFVYHASATDKISTERFKIMERRLYNGIALPGGILTTVFGAWLIYLNHPAYHQPWLHLKLALVILMWGFHFYCDHIRRHFAVDHHLHGEKFYRLLNEVPTVLFISIVILVVVRPNLKYVPNEATKATELVQQEIQKP